MDENEIMTEELTEEIPDLPDDDPDEWERKRREEEEARLAPYRAAAEKRNESAAIIAEHDELLADMLFEMTMNELAE